MKHLGTWMVGLLALTLMLGAPDRAVADRAADGKAWLEGTVEEFLALLRDENFTPDQRLSKVEALAIERFDLDMMSKLVLGKNRRKLSAQQQIEFRDAFRDHISVTYGHNLESFSDEQVVIGDAREEKNGDVTVQSTIVSDGAANGAIVTYRLRSRDGQSWRVIDVMLEGVSTVQNFRAQIQDIVSTRGAEQLVKVIRDKTREESEKRKNGAAATAQ